MCACVCACKSGKHAARRVPILLSTHLPLEPIPHPPCFLGPLLCSCVSTYSRQVVVYRYNDISDIRYIVVHPIHNRSLTLLLRLHLQQASLEVRPDDDLMSVLRTLIRSNCRVLPVMEREGGSSAPLVNQTIGETLNPVMEREGGSSAVKQTIGDM